MLKTLSIGGLPTVLLASDAAFDVVLGAVGAACIGMLGGEDAVGLGISINSK